MLSEQERLLTRGDAKLLLESLGRTVKRVVKVCDDDAILFIGALDRPYTAWLTFHKQGVDVQFENGWSSRPGRNSRVSHPMRSHTFARPDLDLEDPPEYTD